MTNERRFGIRFTEGAENVKMSNVRIEGFDDAILVDKLTTEERRVLEQRDNDLPLNKRKMRRRN